MQIKAPGRPPPPGPGLFSLSVRHSFWHSGPLPEERQESLPNSSRPAPLASPAPGTRQHRPLRNALRPGTARAGTRRLIPGPIHHAGEAPALTCRFGPD